MAQRGYFFSRGQKAGFLIGLVWAFSLFAGAAKAQPAEGVQSTVEMQGTETAPAEEGEESLRERWERAERSENSIDRNSFTGKTREELQADGFIFEDTTRDRSRAHATLFALVAGSVVPGAGHWQLEDRRTTLFLLNMKLVGLSLIGGGVAMALNPTGVDALDARRRDLWFTGIGILGLSWMIDIFGTAYRDDLGIPVSSARTVGWGGSFRYEYVRPQGLSLRHLATAAVTARSERFHLQGRSSQELGYGMSDYELTGRWYLLRGPSPLSRLGVELEGRYTQYRLDEPFERLDSKVVLTGSLNFGRFFAHLDQFSAGMEAGIGLRGYRYPDIEQEWSGLIYSGWYIPMRIFLAMNLTPQLCMDLSFDRWQGSWVERSRNRIGTPRLEFTYRSTDRLDLNFHVDAGDGVSLGAGLTFSVEP